MLRLSRGAGAVALTVLVGGCGSGHQSASAPSTHDSFGDPFITETQAQAVRIGESATAAFRSLGGKAESGSNGPQGPVTQSYDYPIEGTGDGEGSGSEFADPKTVWWKICVSPDGRVVSKERGKMAKLQECSE